MLSHNIFALFKFSFTLIFATDPAEAIYLDYFYFVVITSVGSHRKRVDIIWSSFPRQTGSSILSKSAVTRVFTVFRLCVAGKLIKCLVAVTDTTYFTN